MVLYSGKDACSKIVGKNNFLKLADMVTFPTTISEQCIVL